MTAPSLPSLLALDLAKALIRVESHEQFWALPKEDRLQRLILMQQIQAHEMEWRLLSIQESYRQKDAQRVAYLAGIPEQIRRRGAAQNAIRTLKHRIIARGGYVCGICGDLVSHEQVSIDHIVPISMGGGDNPDNLQVAHRVCNSRKGNRMPEVLTCAVL